MSAIYGQIDCFAALIAPIVGGAMYDWKGYRPTMDIHMLLTFGYAIIYMVFNCGFKVFRQENEKKEN